LSRADATPFIFRGLAPFIRPLAAVVALLAGVPWRGLACSSRIILQWIGHGLPCCPGQGTISGRRRHVALT
jgi:hypothetical protein